MQRAIKKTRRLLLGFLRSTSFFRGSAPFRHRHLDSRQGHFSLAKFFEFLNFSYVFLCQLFLFPPVSHLPSKLFKKIWSAGGFALSLQSHILSLNLLPKWSFGISSNLFFDNVEPPHGCPREQKPELFIPASFGGVWSSPQSQMRARQLINK